ncbi:Os09g0356700 [Oryza sativa Japonica Group]|jgi:hypothetical protein|uniref:Os09g0356700 protein n=2 Tax=Oryza sativa subsp. japonica TaxID=39947 RepID=A0A0P0XLB5_ORYSJ|nr:Os09g0356700 [Oryza sativa Japonica Group]
MSVLREKSALTRYTTMSGIEQIEIQQQLGAPAEGQISMSSDEPLNDEDEDKRGGSVEEDEKDTAKRSGRGQQGFAGVDSHGSTVGDDGCDHGSRLCSSLP